MDPTLFIGAMVHGALALFGLIQAAVSPPPFPPAASPVDPPAIGRPAEAETLESPVL